MKILITGTPLIKTRKNVMIVGVMARACISLNRKERKSLKMTMTILQGSLGSGKSASMVVDLIDFLTTPEIQKLIGEYGVGEYGMQLFTPCAGAEPQ